MSSLNPTLTRGRKFGYATGIVADSVIYNCFYVYFMIFLTNVVGINPVVAGSISLVSVCVDAITDPIMGWIMDMPKVNTRKAMLVGGIIMGIAIGFVFYPVSGSTAFQFAYYVITSAVMWCAYTAFCIPYYAICPQLTTDYNELTQIRGLSSTINGLAVYAGCVFPVLFITILTTGGFDPGMSWTVGAFGMGVIAIIFTFVNHASLRKVELLERNTEDRVENVFKVYSEVFKLKPLKWLLLFIFTFIFGSAMTSANQNYLIMYVAGADPDALAGAAVMTLLCFMLVSPIATAISQKWDRKVAVCVLFGISAVGLIVVRIIGIESMFPVYFVYIFGGIGLAAFWCMFYSFCYDLVALDQYKNGKKREGCITALPNLILKIANAVGLQGIGIVLAMVGYDGAAEVQSPEAVSGIANLSTTYFAILIIISMIMLIIYPIGKNTYNKLMVAVEHRESGDLEYHDADLDKLI